MFHLLKEKTHDKKEASKRKGLANGDGIGGRERSLLKQCQGKQRMACCLFSEKQQQEEEQTAYQACRSSFDEEGQRNVRVVTQSAGLSYIAALASNPCGSRGRLDCLRTPLCHESIPYPSKPHSKEDKSEASNDGPRDAA